MNNIYDLILYFEELKKHLVKRIYQDFNAIYTYMENEHDADQVIFVNRYYDYIHALINIEFTDFKKYMIPIDRPDARVLKNEKPYFDTNWQVYIKLYDQKLIDKYNKWFDQVKYRLMQLAPDNLIKNIKEMQITL